jgi:hypothetical protein
MALAGCVQKWSKPGSTPEEFDAMKASCSAQAYSQFPPRFQQIQASAGYYTPITTQCSGFGGNVSCYQSGGQYIAPIVITIDTNRNARGDAVKSCFYANGWSPVSGDSQSSAPPKTSESQSKAPSANCIPGFDCDF